MNLNTWAIKWGIGQQYRPGSHTCDGVLCEQTYPGGRVELRRIYLDSFARWARKEITK